MNERTVYRHFANEQALRDAVMEHLETRAGIELAGMGLDDVTDVAGRIARVVAGRTRHADHRVDPTLHDASRRQHDALLAAVGAETPELVGRRPPPRGRAARRAVERRVATSTSGRGLGPRPTTRRSAARPGSSTS